MDLSWGTRPGGDVLSPLSAKINASKTCAINECTLAVDDGNVSVCADHAWMRKHIRNWMIISLMVVLANVMLTGIMVYMPWGLPVLRTYSFVLLGPLLFIVFWVIFADFFHAIKESIKVIFSKLRGTYEPCQNY